MIKSRRMRGVGHVARIGSKGMHVGIWWESQKRPLRRHRRRWEDNIKMDRREIGWGGMDWINLAKDRVPWKVLVNTVKTFGLHKMLGNS
jgi:hypothetical protein